MATDTDNSLELAPNIVVPVADLIGKPFQWGGRGPDFFDCYGLVEEFMRRAGMNVPDYKSPNVQEHIADLVGRSVSYWTPCEEGPGAVATIRLGRHISHVAVVMPYGKMIHAWERCGGVSIERLSEWRPRITGFYRFPQ